MGDGPRRVHQVGQATSAAHQSRRAAVTGDEHQDALARRPGTLDAPPPHGVDQLVVHGLSGAAQRHLA